MCDLSIASYHIVIKQAVISTCAKYLLENTFLLEYSFIVLEN